VFHALGLPATGRVRVDPADLEGRQAFVEVRPVEYTAPGGSTVRRNEVPYDGYRPMPEQAANGSAAGPADDPVQDSSFQKAGGRGTRGLGGAAAEEPGEIPF
jgi:hypothetical protein